MTDAEGKKTEEEAQPIEYSVFTREMPSPGEKEGAPERVKTTEDMDEAFKDAKKLFLTGKYKTVEVKKKYFEEKTGRRIEMTLLSFEQKKKKDVSIVLFLVLAMVCGIAAFALTYFLT
jgi:hypothetical protein